MLTFGLERLKGETLSAPCHGGWDGDTIDRGYRTALATAHGSHQRRVVPNDAPSGVGRWHFVSLMHPVFIRRDNHDYSRLTFNQINAKFSTKFSINRGDFIVTCVRR